MRAVLCVALCVVLVASAYAEDLELGQCNDNDLVLVDRNIRRPAIPGIPMYTKLIARAAVRSTISCISVKTTDGTDPDVTVIKGGVGHRFVFILVRGKRGEGLNLRFTARARPRVPPTSKPTTETPTLPTIPTGIPTTTEQVPSTTQTPESPSPPPSSTFTADPPTSGSEQPTTVSPAPTSTLVVDETSASIESSTSTPEATSEPNSIPTGIPTAPSTDGDDNDADDVDLSELLSPDSLGED